MIGAMTRRAVPMAVPDFVAWQQPVEGRQQVCVRAGADLDNDEPGGRVRHEDREQAVAGAGRLGHERGARSRQVDEASCAPRRDRQLTGVYGKMLRMASRSRPSPPPTGADS